jgi:anti-sigma factor RsiW
MKEKSNATGLNNGANPRGCERAEELVTYLYGEARPEDEKAFRQHLNACAVCREELAAFGAVREAVGEWRAQALSTVPSLNIGEELSPAINSHSRRAPERKRSAVAALREFFTLSPLWLQAGAAAAVLVVCGLAALTFARTEVRWDANGLAFRTGVKEGVVQAPAQVPVKSGYTEDQLSAAVKQGEERGAASERARLEDEYAQRVSLLETQLQQQKLATRNAVLLANRQSPRRGPGNAQRTQLVDARRENEDYFSTREERGVPRLTDLLGAVNNPQ